METQGIEDFFVSGGEGLARAGGIIFVEGVVGALHAAVEKVARSGRLAEVGQFRSAAVYGKIGGRGRDAVSDQSRARAGKPVKVENVGWRSVRRSIRHAAHRVGQFVQRHANQQVGVDVGRK